MSTTFMETRARADRSYLLRGGRIYLWMLLFSLAVGAFSLHYPSTPSYDPWSWLNWGREIEHGHLKIAGGSSWKPLPVIFTTVFALFGSAQPNLWLLIARAGAVLTVLMTGKLTARLTWQLTIRYRQPADLDAGPSGRDGRLADRAVLIAPAVLAAVGAMYCSTFTKAFPGNMLLGYSEGVAAAALLIAAERAWDGHHRQAFAVGMLAALDRPETWVLWGPYGLWVMWKDRHSWRRTWPLVAGLGLLMLLLWVVPQNLGGGTTKGLVTHPEHNHSLSSAVHASFPFWHELAYVVWPLTIERVEAAALIEIFVTFGLVAWAARGSSGWRSLGAWRTGITRYRPAVIAAVFSAFGMCWWLLISAETQAGFAGNPRYAVFGVFAIYIGGCTAFAWAGLGIARAIGWLLTRLRARRESRPGPAARPGARGGWLHDWRPHLAIGTVVMAVIFVFVPNMFNHRFNTIRSIRYEQRFQAQLREGISALITRAGGPAKVFACGSVMADNFQVTAVAWYMDSPINFIQALPTKLTKVRPGPNVIFQNSVTAGKPSQPSAKQVQIWEQGWQQKNGSKYTTITSGRVTMYMDCSAYIVKA